MTGIIVTLFNILACTYFLFSDGSFTIIYFAGIAYLLESIRGYATGELKSFSIPLSIIIAGVLVGIANGYKIFASICLFLCIGGAIIGTLGILFTIWMMIFSEYKNQPQQLPTISEPPNEKQKQPEIDKAIQDYENLINQAKKQAEHIEKLKAHKQNLYSEQNNNPENYPPPF